MVVVSSHISVSSHVVFSGPYLIEILTCLQSSLCIALVYAGWQVDHEHSRTPHYVVFLSDSG